jgi:hypothetical protein
MNIQVTESIKQTPSKTWMKKMSWAIPLFFLIKGLAWLSVPVISAVYMVD